MCLEHWARIITALRLLSLDIGRVQINNTSQNLIAVLDREMRFQLKLCFHRKYPAFCDVFFIVKIQNIWTAPTLSQVISEN